MTPLKTPALPEKDDSTERALLLRIDTKLDAISSDMRSIKRQSAYTSAFVGGLSGGIVSVAIAYIRAKMGL